MTYINPVTGKGWTDAEERTFAEIMATSRLSRIEAIQLWKRCSKDEVKALRLAKEIARNLARRSWWLFGRREKPTKGRFYRRKWAVLLTSPLRWQPTA